MAATMKQLRAELAGILALKKQTLTESDASLLPDLLDIVIAQSSETEEFWEQKCKGYFPYATKPEDESFEIFFGKELNNLLDASKHNLYALSRAGNEAINNPEIVLAAVNQNWRALKYAGDIVESNPGIVLAAVTQDWRAVRLVGSEVRNNPEVMVAAVRQNGRALRYASDDIKDNPDIVRIAVEQHPGAIHFASQRIQQNPGLLAVIASSTSTSSGLSGDGFFQQGSNNSDSSAEEKDENKPKAP